MTGAELSEWYAYFKTTGEIQQAAAAGVEFDMAFELGWEPRSTDADD